MRWLRTWSSVLEKATTEAVNGEELTLARIPCADPRIRPLTSPSHDQAPIEVQSVLPALVYQNLGTATHTMTRPPSSARVVKAAVLDDDDVAVAAGPFGGGGAGFQQTS